GKSVAVNKGTPYETLSKQMGEKYGFTVQVYDTQPDATQAVLSGRAYATLGGNTTIVYAASKNPNFIADLELKDTRAHWAAPVPKDNPKLRAQLQEALDGMKKDGTMAKFYEKWFNKKPESDDLAVVITPGYGPPGMPVHEPTPHELHCGRCQIVIPSEAKRSRGTFLVARSSRKAPTLRPFRPPVGVTA